MTAPFITSPAFKNMPIIHGFFGRQGGVSPEPYASLNAGLSTGDTPENVRENLARIAAAMNTPADKLFVLNQVHGPACHVADPDWVAGSLPDGDALVTDKPGMALGVLTGDCVPVLLATGKVVGAAHAGWGGALKGVIESTIGAMEKLGAKRDDIRAAIGPCIGARSYEVSAGFETPFLQEDPEAEHFFKPGRAEGKYLFDLPGYCAYRLGRAGITRVDMADKDTLALENDYFSHRRTVLAGGSKRGLQLSVIALKTA